MIPIVVPITDVLDLHTFRPKEVPGLLDEYFIACIGKGIFQVRVIHGKGQGVLRNRVRSILKKHPLVLSYTEAPHDAGGWGAVMVNLKKGEDGVI